MGREIRRVPPQWEHPRYTREDAKYSNWVGKHKPLHDCPYAAEAQEWLDDCVLWQRGEHPDQKNEKVDVSMYAFFWEWGGNPPDPEHYRPEWDAEPTGWVVYETVSEGTPVTPVFATADELIDYLAAYGDFWAQSRGERPPTREAAKAFVESGWAPSMMMSAAGVKGPYEIAAAQSDDDAR